MEQLKKGFKRTEIGMIPGDWEVYTLGEIGTFKNGINKSKEDFGHGSPFINLLHVFGKNYIDNSIELGLVNSNEFERQLYSLKKGDVIFVRSSVKPSGVGLTILCKEDLPNAVFSGFLIRYRDNEKIDLNFKIHCFYEESFRDRLISNSTVSANTNINQVALKSLLIPLPPTKAEQTAIATVLNDTDALINKMEQLIAKKRQIQHGAMQELLRPKEGWRWTTVEKLGNPYGGLSGKSKEDFSNGNHPYIPFLNVLSNPIIDTNYFDYVKIGPIENQHRAEKGDLFFNVSSETPEEVGMCSVLLEEIPNLYLNSFCFGFRLFKENKNDGLYLSYFFRSNYGRQIFYTLAQGATRHNLSKSNFMKIEIQIPTSEEQVKIAAILRDMDNEIEVFEKRLEKYKMIKQGMMQVLLTGKIRLV